jgi:hypothetical protein
MINLKQSLAAAALILAVFSAPNTTAADSTSEIIYDNTTTPMLDNSVSPARSRYADSTVEYGDQLQLAGTARTITDIYIEYYGNFTAQGDEYARLRVYNNKNTYDLFRKSPTDILFESDFFKAYPGYNTYALHNLNITVPDIITLSLEFSGLGAGEDAGFLMYSPPTVGLSYNEFWRRTTVGGWEAFLYSLTDPTFKANASIRIVAYIAPIDLDIQVTQDTIELKWNSQGASFQIERASSAAGPFEIVGTTSEMFWSEPFNASQNAFYRVKRM